MGIRRNFSIVPHIKNLEDTPPWEPLQNDLPIDDESLYLWQERHRFTDDLQTLENYETQRVFIYDQLMHQHSGNSFMEFMASPQNPYLATGFTLESFSLLRRKLGRHSMALAMKSKLCNEYIPWFRKSTLNMPHLPIRGELYEVPAVEGIVKLDNLYLNGVQFERRRTSIIIPYREIYQIKDVNAPYGKRFALSSYNSITVRAWIYVAVEAYWDSKIDRGYEYVPAETFTSTKEMFADVSITLRDYYYFAKEELKLNE